MPTTPPSTSAPTSTDEPTAPDEADTAVIDESLPDGGMPAADRARILDTFSTLRPLSDARRDHLDALLTQAGKNILPLTGPALTRAAIAANVTDAGQYPSGTSKPTAGADFFLLARGRIELSDHHAVFHPTGVGQSIRASAAAEPADEPEDVDATAQPATPPAESSSRLTDAQLRQILTAIESKTGAKLTPTQSTTLRTHLKAPGQTYFIPPTGPGALPVTAQVTSATLNNGTLTFTTPTGYMSLSQNGTLAGSATFNFTTTPAANFAAVRAPLLLTMVLSFLSLGLAVLLLIAGVFVLRNSPHGRKLHLIFAYAKIPLALLTLATWVSLTSGFSALSRGPAAATPTWAFSLLYVIPTLLAMIYPVALLIVFHTRTVRDYYSPVLNR
jgi:hypothetical protein